MNADESPETPQPPLNPSEALTAPDPAANWNVPPLHTEGDAPSTGDAPSQPLYSPFGGAPPPPASHPIYFPLLGTPPKRQQADNRLVLLGLGGVGAILLIFGVLFLFQRLGILGGNSVGPTIILPPPPPGRQPPDGPPPILITTTPGVFVTTTPGPPPPPPPPPPTGTPPPNTPTPTGHLPVSIICLLSPDHNHATLCVQTAAKAALTIATLDCDGKLDAAAPASGTADSRGFFTVDWQPRQPTGGCNTATVIVTSSLNHRQGQTQGTLTIGP